jgi:RHS repeat-associated protein
VAALVKGTDGTISAQYEYGPFAEPIRVTGPMGKTNPIRFSSKYTDDESDFLYYGHRYYNPSTGRWLNRDPIVEEGGENLYGFVYNDPMASTDMDGLRVIPIPRPTPIPRPPPIPLPLPVPLPMPSPASPDSGDLNNPIRTWIDTAAGTEIEKMRGSWSRQKAFDACYELARKRLSQNQYFYASANSQRAMGAAAVLWKKDNKPRSKWRPRGFLAAQFHRLGSVDRGHLIPAPYGGKADEQNVVTQEAKYNQGRFLELISDKLDALLPLGRGPCNWVCLVVVPSYRPRWKPVPQGFEITIINKFDMYEHFFDSQPLIRGDLDKDIEPWRSMGLGLTDLNYEVLQAGL